MTGFPSGGQDVNRKELRNFVTGMAFIGPNLLGVFIFILFPIVFSLVLSFSEWDLQNGLGGLNMKSECG